MNGKIISEETEKVIKVTPEETEKAINTNQESATFLVIGDKAYTSEIIEEYNRNAEAKTEAFNTNAENKTASYNSNAADRTTAFNNNYDDKMAAFNSNANTQKEEFDSHVLIQTNTFNKNAASKLQEYNDNATQKIEEYNAHSQELDNKIVSTRNELERVKNDILETGTDTDTFIHLEDSAMAEYQELSVDGVCKQETTSVSAGDEYNSPNPDHPQPISTIENSLKITSCNKNLINVSKYSDNNYVSQKLFIPVGEYTVKYTGDTSSGIYVRKANGTTPINGTPIIERYNINQLTFTITESGEYYIQFYKSGNGFTLFENAQLEKGTQATPFEQHLETQITANLPDGEFIGKISDTYKDTLKVEYNETDGQYHLNLYKNIGKGIINLIGTSLDTDNVKYFWFYKPENDRSYDTWGAGYIISTIALLERNNPIYIENGANKTQYAISYNKSKISNIPSVEELKALVDGKPFYYQLKTPYVVDLGVVDMPITYNEITNLFTDSDLMPTINAKYYRNFITTIQNLQVNEKALKQELVDINTRLSALESAQTNVVSESEVVE